MASSASSAEPSPLHGPVDASSRTAAARNLNPYPSALPPGRAGGRTSSPATGSVTRTIAADSSRSSSPEPLILRLRGSPDTVGASTSTGTGTHTQRRRRRRITWAEDVIDNEGLGRKSSKVCCIYHKNREVGESSSDESSSSSDSDSDSNGSDSHDDDGSARMARGRADACGHGHAPGKAKARRTKRKPSPNAYEKMPQHHNTR